MTELRVEDGVFAYRDDHTGHVALVSVPTLAATAASPEAPLHVTADAAVNGLSFKINAETGFFEALQQPAPNPWPIKATVTAAVPR